MASARYTMLMLRGAKAQWLGMTIKRRLCAASRGRATQRQRSSVDAVVVPKVIRLRSPPERNRASDLVPFAIDVDLTAEPDRNERVDGAERVVRDDEPEILQ